MADYAKLTVVKLKEELDRRGLHKTGLKAALVQRLEEDDQIKQSDGGDQHAAQIEPAQEVNVLPGTLTQTASWDNPLNQQHQQQLPTPAQTQTEDTQPPHDDSLSTTARETVPSSSQPVQESSHVPSTQTSVAEEPAPPSQQHVPSTQGSIAPEEIAEDTRKRKRRSQSPPPLSAIETLKKAKTDANDDDTVKERPDVKVPEDHEAQMSGALQPPEDHMQATMEKSTKAEATEPDDQDKSSAVAAPDRRFKALTSRASPPSIPNTLDSQVEATEEDSALPDVAPSIHLPTKAIYVRNLMRPIHPNSLRAHLASLATKGVKEKEIEEEEQGVRRFHIDGIRTHCFAVFDSVEAATQVRARLHEQVWPFNERDRKPLWVDFVPEAKVARWIEVENGEDQRGGRSMQRWEVVYEEEEEEEDAQSKEGMSVQAYLQEVGAGSSQSQPPRLMRKGEGKTAAVVDEEEKSVAAPAIAPQIAAAAPPPPASSESREFKALDDIFKSTLRAKPKLYYLPVSEDRVQQRLGLLKTSGQRRAEYRGGGGRGRGRGEEMRRFSFEDGIVVDRGPEYGAGRGAPPMRGRGGDWRRWR